MEMQKLGATIKLIGVEPNESAFLDIFLFFIYKSLCFSAITGRSWLIKEENKIASSQVWVRFLRNMMVQLRNMDNFLSLISDFSVIKVELS